MWLSTDFVFCGVRSLKVTVIDAGLRLVKTAKVHYDTDLPHYGTKDGVHRDPHGEHLLTFQNPLYLMHVRFEQSLDTVLYIHMNVSKCFSW